MLLTSLSTSVDSSSRAFVSGSFAYEKISMSYWVIDSKGGKGGLQQAFHDLSKDGAASAQFASVFAQGMSGPTLLAAVPEPEMFSMLLVGIGVIGFARQFRKLKAGD